MGPLQLQTQCLSGHPPRSRGLTPGLLAPTSPIVANIATVTNVHPRHVGVQVGKHFNRSMAVMDTKLYDFKLVYGVEPSMDKKTRLLYNDSLMTHAMVFTGYDKDGDGAITKW